jgi:uncharacterized membrane protein YfcA
MTVWLVAALGAFIGVAAGLLGAGASILTVLVLIHVAHLRLESAITTSLVIVSGTSLIAIVPYARAGAVRWREGAGFTLTSMVGAYLGGRTSALLPAKVLLVLFLLTMLFAALVMLRKTTLPPETSRGSALVIVVAGLLVGLLTGLVGLGGGFAVLPILVVYLGLPLRAAVGTSLFVVGANSVAGLAGHFPHLAIDWSIVGSVGLTTSMGSLIGAYLHKRIDTNTLRRAFAAIMLVTASVLLIIEAR